eukprot:gene30210-35194_t
MSGVVFRHPSKVLTPVAPLNLAPVALLMKNLREEVYPLLCAISGSDTETPSEVVEPERVRA